MSGSISRTTHRLVARIKDGDASAFDPLFDRFYPRLRLTLRSRMSSRLREHADPDDVIQDIYMEVFRNFHKFELRDPESFWKWLLTVARWKVRDLGKHHFHTGKRADASAQSLDAPVNRDATSEAALASTVAGDGTSPYESVERRERVEALERAMAQLPAHYAEVIRLRHFEQLSAKDVGDSMGLSSNAVNVLFHRAQKKLSEVLAGIEGGAAS